MRRRGERRRGITVELARIYGRTDGWLEVRDVKRRIRRKVAALKKGKCPGGRRENRDRKRGEGGNKWLAEEHKRRYKAGEL